MPLVFRSSRTPRGTTGVIASRSKCALGSINNILLKKFARARRRSANACFPAGGLRGISLYKVAFLPVHLPIPHPFWDDHEFRLARQNDLICRRGSGSSMRAFRRCYSNRSSPVGERCSFFFPGGLRNSLLSYRTGKGFLVFIFRRRTFNCNGCAPSDSADERLISKIYKIGRFSSRVETETNE